MTPASQTLHDLFAFFGPATFHFLRPGWLLAIVPALLLAALAFHRIGAGGSPWRHLVDAHLLRHLSVQETARARRWPALALLLGWVLAALAMAGPAWEKLPTPALDRLDPTVIVLSLAQSMNAADQSPSRLGAARHKVDDILARMRGGQVGLVIYADAPFVAAPLTEDARIVAQMLPELSTELMPVLADRPDLAIGRAATLLRDAGAPAGRIVLISDGAGDDSAATVAAAKAAAQAGYRVNVIGVGTQAGSPLLAFDGGVLRARDGTVLTTRMDEAGLREIAAAGRGSFSAMTVGDNDLDTVLAKASGSAAPLDTVLQDSGLSADQWLDMGPWLLLGVLALAPLAFRRGWIAVLLMAALAGALAPRDALAQGTGQQGAGPQGAPAQTLDLRGLDGQSAQPQNPQAQDPQGAGRRPGPEAGPSQAWTGLWRTPDQQGADAFARADYGAAARSFENPQWQASALYKAGAFEEAAAAYATVPDGDYNRGNALARAGKLEEALKAYDAALAAHPGQDDPIRADALFNRDLVQKLLDQRKKDQQKKDQDKKDQDKPDPKSGNDQKPKDEPGKDENKDKPQKPGDDKKPDQPPPAPDPKGTPQKPEPKPEPPKPEPPKAPPKPEPQKPEPQKPEPQKPEPPKSEPPKPNPPEQKPPEQKPPEQKPPEPPPQQPEPPQPPQQPGAPKPLTEEDQNRAQTLRLVPDDPTGLLRARIRSHYGGAGVVDPPQN
ncbi:VWA domain-containing protein [Roseixanthobacter liquoris]|uniref:VWA domain-containing protein n=1 Tax=Roseixanthobacter liquoris TaxID=3119921 RepID=UPI003728BC4D